MSSLLGLRFLGRDDGTAGLALKGQQFCRDGGKLLLWLDPAAD
jgi:hypothetical protein